MNDSPLGGKEGTMLTSSAIAERLAREAASNISLQVRAWRRGRCGGGA